MQLACTNAKLARMISIRATLCKSSVIYARTSSMRRPRGPVRSERAGGIANPARHRTTQARAEPDDLVRERDATQAPGRCRDRGRTGVETIRPDTSVVIERHMPVDGPQSVRIGACTHARRRAGGALAG